MKPKKNLNKLTLKKETISNLNQREMTKVQGGYSIDTECPTYDANCTYSVIGICKRYEPATLTETNSAPNCC